MSAEKKNQTALLQENEALRRDNEALRARLEEAEETLRAIREGEVDAVIVGGPEGNRVFTLQGAEQSYRVLVEQMREGAVTLVVDGSIQYSNRAFAQMLRRPLQQVIGSPVREYVAEADRALFDALLQQCQQGSARGEVSLVSGGRQVPAYLSLNALVVNGLSSICVVVTDLTEQKHSEKVLADQRFSRAILNQAGDAIVVWDIEGRVTFANAAARRMARMDPMGTTLDIAPQVWGKPCEADGRPLAVEDWPSSLALRGQASIGREVRMVRDDRGHYDLLISASPLRNADGSMIGAVATFGDITRLKVAEETLHRQKEELQVTVEEIQTVEEELRTQNEQMARAQGELVAQRQRYEDLFQFAPDAYLVTDLEGKIREANRAAVELLNRPADELIGQSLERYVAKGTRDAFRAQLLHLRTPGTQQQGEWTFHPIERPAFQADVTIASMAEGTVSPGHCRWLIRDITERKRMEEALRESEARLRLLVQGVRDHAIYMLDPQGRVMTWNYGAQRVKGHAASEILGEHFSRFYTAEDRDLGKPARALAIARERGEYADEGWRVRKDGSRFWASVTLTALHDEAGNLRGFVKIARDITERKRAEEALRESEQFISSIAAASPNCFYVFDLDSMGLSYANRPMLGDLGFPPDVQSGVLGLEAFRRFMPPEEMPHLARVIQEWQTLADGRVREDEYRLRHADGSLRCFAGREIVFARRSDGTVRQILGMLVDITERKRAEESLRESEQRFRAFFDTVAVGTAQMDTSGRFLQVNDRYCQITGYSREELLALNVGDLTHPADRASDSEQLAAYLHGDTPVYDAEKRYVRKDGSVIWVQVTAGLIRDAEGKPLRSAGIIQDITERKRLAEALEAAARLPQENPDAVMRISQNGTLSYANPAAKVLLNAWANGADSGLPATIREAGAGALSDGLRREVEFRWGERTYLMNLAPIPEAGYVNAYARDITERKRAELRLAEQARELARSNAELGQFASVVSHDLRAPLSSLAGSADLLTAEADQLSQEARECVGWIQCSVQDMTRLIDSLLHYSRIGQGQLKRTPCGLQDVLDGVIRNLHANLNAEGAQVSHDPLPVIQGDPALLAQLLQNLIGNAIKYRSQAPPRVHVSARQVPGEWVISVADNGIGIDPQHFAKIFQIFQRLHRDESKYPGVGVGLATCKKIVEKHGGRIWVESQPGQGSTFSFSLPG